MYLCNVVLYGLTNILTIIQTKKTMNKIKIASELFKEKAENTTNGTAFIVNTEKDRITLTPDADRRDGLDMGTFYHMETVVAICKPLGLSFWISAKPYVNRHGINDATFEVHIY